MLERDYVQRVKGRSVMKKIRLFLLFIGISIFNVDSPVIASDNIDHEVSNNVNKMADNVVSFHQKRKKPYLLYQKVTLTPDIGFEKHPQQILSNSDNESSYLGMLYCAISGNLVFGKKSTLTK